MTSFVVTIPGSPPAVLSPNSRVGWREKNKAKRAWAEVTELATIDALGWSTPLLDGIEACDVFVLDYDVYWGKGRKFADDDNLIATFKSGVRDAIAHVLGVDDRRFRTGRVSQQRDRTGTGYLAVTVSWDWPLGLDK